MTLDGSDAPRKDVQVLYETIDRNKERDWADYADEYEFTLVSDGVVSVEKPDGKDGGRYQVELGETGAVDCNCFIASRPSQNRSCRHMRAVDLHPRL